MHDAEHPDVAPLRSQPGDCKAANHPGCRGALVYIANDTVGGQTSRFRLYIGGVISTATWDGEMDKRNHGLTRYLVGQLGQNQDCDHTNETANQATIPLAHFISTSY